MSEKPRRWCDECGAEVYVWPGIPTEYFCPKCKSYVHDVNHEPPENQPDHIAELKAERDKYKAALEQIIPNCMPVDDDDAVAIIRDIAEEALKGGE